MRLYKVVQIGFGSLGKEIFIELWKRKNLKLVGVIDIDKDKIGNDAGILALNRRASIKIIGNINLIKSKPDVAIHATTSSLKDSFDQIYQLLKHRISVISTCEQLVYPYGTNTKLAKTLDIIAKKYKVSVLGVGVNPGFVMDSFVLMLTSLCSKIDHLRIERVVDIARRRKALQEKMCLGFTLEQFEKVKHNVGHVGLHESARMICDTLKGKRTTFSSTIRPVIANRPLQSYGVKVEVGQVAGIEHRLVARKNDSKFLEILLYMFAGASEFDLVEIEGIPPIYVRTNGISGDQATVALVLNYIPIILGVEAGLHTVKDLRIPSAT
ncbi:MAG: hypothetical protein ACE5KA_05580 [Nitrososphaerales archaeon]